MNSGNERWMMRLKAIEAEYYSIGNKKRVTTTMVEFYSQCTQRLVDEYKHTSGRNDRWSMQLKLIQEEYYSIENQKS